MGERSGVHPLPTLLEIPIQHKTGRGSVVVILDISNTLKLVIIYLSVTFGGLYFLSIVKHLVLLQ